VTIDERLQDLVAEVQQGRTPAATVRDLLSWYPASRRGYWINQGIRYALKKAGLRTDPDFESAYIDAVIRFVPVGAPEEPAEAPPAGPAEPAPIQPAAPQPITPDTPIPDADPTYRISKTCIREPTTGLRSPRRATERSSDDHARE
jgi:hypothetical protein